MTDNRKDSDMELRQLIITIGRWFDGFGKFAMMINRSHDERISGENNMIQRLVQESHRIDLYLKNRFEHYCTEAVSEVQQRLLDTGRVGEAFSCTPDEFWTTVLTNEERQLLSCGHTKKKAFDLCLYEPLRELFGLSGYPHRLYCLDDGSIKARLFVAEVNAGVVSVIVGESVTPVIMEGTTARMIDAFSLAELIDTDLDCAVDIGGYRIEFGSATSTSEIA